MDNARIHKALKIFPVLDSLNIFYSAPYSPFLNPIEEVFGTWK
jgi:transposase